MVVDGAVMYAPGDVRVEERPDPEIVDATDAIIRVSAACVCGSDLWPYRGVEALEWPAPMGHEYAGVVEEVGRDVETIRPGQFVVGSFWASDNTCELCPGRLSERLRQPRTDGRLGRPSCVAASPVCRRHARGHLGPPRR